jgi:hypothetical protein
MLAIDGFKANIAQARELGQLYQSLSAIITPALNVDDLLRSQIVMSVSALDYFIHEVVRQGMLEIYEGTRPAVPGFSKFQVPLIDAKSSVPSSSSEWVDAAIRQSHSFLSFQQPDKIADAIRLIYQPALWPALEISLARPAADLKEQLKLIVDRRNKIAHEADANPSYPGVRWPISYQDVTSATDFIEKIVNAINDEIKYTH